ncbi:MAG: preprotein translocase subunit YajC, partial [Deltaproteobacteria bacterium]|nr:preprotein translocase subunit YajC [Deltaproteobacteria bacterium]
MIDSIILALGAGGAEGGGGGFQPLILMGAMFAIFYFLLIRPQQKKTKEHRQMLSNLRKGDRIVTSGGIHGRITGMDETTLTVQIAEKVRVKVSRANVAGLLTSASQAQTPKKEK